MGDVYFRAENPQVAARFTYFFNEDLKTNRQQRLARHKKDIKAGKAISYPSKEALEAEDVEEAPFLIFIIFDNNDKILTRVKTRASKGINRVTWNMRYPSMSASSGRSRYGRSGGPYVPPGTYKVALSKSVEGQITQLTNPLEFNIVAFDNSNLQMANAQEKFEFLKEVDKLSATVSAASRIASDYRSQMTTIQTVLLTAPVETGKLMEKTKEIDNQLFEILTSISGRPVRAARVDSYPPTIMGRLGFARRASTSSWHGITGSEQEQYNIAREEFVPVLNKLKELIEVDINNLEQELNKAGIPWTQGRFPEL